LEARIVPERIEHRIELKQRRSKRYYDAAARHREYFLYAFGISHGILARARRTMGNEAGMGLNEEKDE